MVILVRLQTHVFAVFQIRFFHLPQSFPSPLSRSFTFVFPTLDNTASKFVLKFGKAFSHINLLFGSRPSLRLSHFFVFKDRIPEALRSYVVHLFKCQRCSSSYVGQTSRPLHTQISEHLGISGLTGKKRVISPTNILSHHCDTGHNISSNDFNILSSSSFNSELLVRESFLIRKLNQSLNTNMGSFPLSLFQDFSFPDISSTYQFAISFCLFHFRSYANIL